MILRGLAYLGRDIDSALGDALSAGIVAVDSLAPWVRNADYWQSVEMTDTNEGMSE
jgi:hypothetical protein